MVDENAPQNKRPRRETRKRQAGDSNYEQKEKQRPRLRNTFAWPQLPSLKKTSVINDATDNFCLTIANDQTIGALFSTMFLHKNEPPCHPQPTIHKPKPTVHKRLLTMGPVPLLFSPFVGSWRNGRFFPVRGFVFVISDE